VKKCPFCAKEILEESLVCRFCKADVPPGNPLEQPNNIAQVSKVKALQGVKLASKFTLVNIGIAIMLVIISCFIFYFAAGLSSLEDLPLVHQMLYLALLIGMIVIPAILFVWYILKK